MVPVLIDWLTVTVADWDKHDAHTPVLIDQLLQGQAVPSKHRTGARGWYGRQSFVGSYDGGRLLIELSGTWAGAVAHRVDRLLPKDGRSVARLDAQVTIWVGDADAIITTIVPNRRYRCTLMRNLFGAGATLYVGAPSSDMRMRVYNKSAESGAYPDAGGEWLRIEVQLRDRYADRAFQAYNAGALSGTFLEYVRRALDERTYRMLRDTVVLQEAPLLSEDDDDDWMARRVYWLRHTVIPALRRLALHDEQGRQEVELALRAIMDVPGLAYPGVSDSEVR